MNSPATHGGTALLAIAVSLFVSPLAAADVVTDWNVEAADIVVAGEVPAAPAVRLMAIVQPCMKRSTPLPSAIRRGA